MDIQKPQSRHKLSNQLRAVWDEYRILIIIGVIAFLMAIAEVALYLTGKLSP